MTTTIIKPAPSFETSVGNPNHIEVIADLNNATWKSVATHEVFTVTGVVRMAIWIEITEAPVSGGLTTFTFGDELNAASLIASTTKAAMGTNHHLWYSDTPAYTNAATTAILDRVASEVDFGYEVGTAATTDGTLVFHCVWQPMSSDGLVTAGAGGPL